MHPYFLNLVCLPPPPFPPSHGHSYKMIIRMHAMLQWHGNPKKETLLRNCFTHFQTYRVGQSLGMKKDFFEINKHKNKIRGQDIKYDEVKRVVYLYIQVLVCSLFERYVKICPLHKNYFGDVQCKNKKQLPLFYFQIQFYSFYFDYHLFLDLDRFKA